MNTGTEGGGARLSFEFFPQKPEAMLREMRLLEPWRPHSFSVTSRQRDPEQTQTLEAVRGIRAGGDVPPVLPHLVLGPDPGRLRGLIGQYLDAGIRGFVAIRGDNFTRLGYEKAYGRQMYGADLVSMVHEVARQGGHAPPQVEVGCYPEGHPLTPAWEDGLPHLCDKLARGAQVAVGQMCYDAGALLRFRDALAAAAPGAEFVPGLMPILSLAHCRRVAASCDAHLPQALQDRLAPLSEDDQAEAGTEILGDLCRRLLDGGVQRLHFYAFNRAQPCMNALTAAGLEPAALAL